jgi:hypothetical protein
MEPHPQHSICPECGKEVKIDEGAEIRTTLCPYCGAKVDFEFVDDGLNTGPEKVLSKTIKIVFAGLVLFILVALFFICTHANVGKLTQVQSINKNTVELLGWSWGRMEDGKTVEVIGQVKNISDVPLPGIQAVVVFYDKQNSEISRETTVINESITPSQAYPFRLTRTFNPAMEKAGIIFLSLKGDTLRTEDKK